MSAVTQSLKADQSARITTLREDVLWHLLSQPEIGTLRCGRERLEAQVLGHSMKDGSSISREELVAAIEDLRRNGQVRTYEQNKDGAGVEYVEMTELGKTQAERDKTQRFSSTL